MKLTVGLRVQSDLKSNRCAEHAPRAEDPGSSAVQLCQDSQGGSMQAGDSRSSSSRLFRWPGRRPAHAAPPEAIPEVPTAAESGPSLAREEGDGFPPHYLIRAATLMLGAVRVRAAGADARPGPRNRSSDARGSSPGCLLRCLSATILLPLQHLAEQTGVQGRQSRHLLPAT